jgi:hypothetical protein
MELFPISWNESVSLEDRVITLFIEKRTNCEEFQTYLRIFGRDKIKAIWDKYVALKNSSLK